MVINKKYIMPDTLQLCPVKGRSLEMSEQCAFFPNVFSKHNMSRLRRSILIFVVLHISPQKYINPQI